MIDFQPGIQFSERDVAFHTLRNQCILFIKLEYIFNPKIELRADLVLEMSIIT